MKKLFVQNDDGSFEQVSAVAFGDNFNSVKSVKIEDAINHYISACTSQKCLKNQKVEKALFESFKKFIIDKNINIVSEITNYHLIEYQNHLLKKMKASSSNRRFCTIKNFFVMCEQWEYVLKNPAKDIRKKRVESNPYKNWTQKEFNLFIASTDGAWSNLFRFLWLTGCRPIEAKNLKWTDIDYDSGVIIFNCGKNSSINRNFPITDELSVLLHQIEMQCAYVFSKDKKQINNDALYHYAKKRLKKLNLGHISVYGMRHSFAERLAKANVSPYYIQKLMGHSDIKTTMGYVHDDKNNLKQVLNLAKY